MASKKATRAGAFARNFGLRKSGAIAEAVAPVVFFSAHESLQVESLRRIHSNDRWVWKTRNGPGVRYRAQVLGPNSQAAEGQLNNSPSAGDRRIRAADAHVAGIRGP